MRASNIMNYESILQVVQWLRSQAVLCITHGRS